MTTAEYSTCMASCEHGWTSDGNPDLVCERCDVSCERCKDEGFEGDASRCTICAEGYDLRMGDLCLKECPFGTFESLGRCLPCDEKCASCDGSGDFCTSCSPIGSLNYLYGNTCIEECPSGMGNNAGICFDCEFPCAECSTGPSICKECDQSQGTLYLFAASCL